MNNRLPIIISLLVIVFMGSQVLAEEMPLTGEETPPSEGGAVEDDAQTPKITPEVSPEVSVKACRDQVDNDNDGAVDCDDEGCQIFAICVTARLPGYVATPEAAWIPERGRRCSDGVDNNDDGYIDCHEVSCQKYRYCRQKMYETPESPNKAPGFFMNFGFGLALPNYRTPTAHTEAMGYWTDQYDEIPFDPDMGVIGDIKAGYLFLKWLGVGVKFLGALTGANNYAEFIETYDSPDLYRYYGSKTYAYFGGFVRFQYPFKRFVPYLDVALGGFSAARYRWKIYSPDNDWDEIREEDHVGPEETYEYESRHYTFALEPGFDFFVARRVFAVGMKAWLPVFAYPYGQSSNDNLGIMISLTYAPMWREHPRLKKEYDHVIPKPVPVPVELGMNAEEETVESVVSVESDQGETVHVMDLNPEGSAPGTADSESSTGGSEK
jgi:hypothetical protein